MKKGYTWFHRKWVKTKSVQNKQVQMARNPLMPKPLSKMFQCTLHAHIAMKKLSLVPVSNLENIPIGPRPVYAYFSKYEWAFRSKYILFLLYEWLLEKIHSLWLEISPWIWLFRDLHVFKTRVSNQIFRLCFTEADGFFHWK